MPRWRVAASVLAMALPRSRTVASGSPKMATVCSTAGRKAGSFSLAILTACKTQLRKPSKHRKVPPLPLSLVASRCRA